MRPRPTAFPVKRALERLDAAGVVRARHQPALRRANNAHNVTPLTCARFALNSALNSAFAVNPRCFELLAQPFPLLAQNLRNTTAQFRTILALNNNNAQVTRCAQAARSHHPTQPCARTPTPADTPRHRAQEVHLTTD